MSREAVPREHPKPFIETALTLYRKRGLSSIVELGSMRSKLDHPLDELRGSCCLDGHSSIYWAAETDDFTTVDVSFATSVNVGCAIKELLDKFVDVRCMDGIEYLEQRNRPIDLLFLDAWDANLPGSAENHFMAFRAAEANLHAASLVLIDDTDVEPDGMGYIKASDDGLSGKGKLIIDHAASDGWEILFRGRQTLLARAVSIEEKELVIAELERRRETVRSALAAAA